MKNTSVVIYDYPHNSYLELVIKDDSFTFISEVRINEDDYSEVHYSIDKEQASKLLGIISFDDFIELAKKEHLKGILDFYKKNDIQYITTSIY